MPGQIGSCVGSDNPKQLLLGAPYTVRYIVNDTDRFNHVSTLRYEFWIFPMRLTKGEWTKQLVVSVDDYGLSFYVISLVRKYTNSTNFYEN